MSTTLTTPARSDPVTAVLPQAPTVTVDEARRAIDAAAASIVRALRECPTTPDPTQLAALHRELAAIQRRLGLCLAVVDRTAARTGADPQVPAHCGRRVVARTEVVRDLTTGQALLYVHFADGGVRALVAGAPSGLPGAPRTIYWSPRGARTRRLCGGHIVHDRPLGYESACYPAGAELSGGLLDQLAALPSARPWLQAVGLVATPRAVAA